MMGSWSTDAPGGFSESMIAALLRIQNHLAVAAKMAVLNKLADNMLTTYLGGDAGKRVLNGQIKRGEGDTIRAALVMADMRGSTDAGRKGRPRGLYRYAEPVLRCHRRAVQPQRRPDSEFPRRWLPAPSIPANGTASRRKSPAERRSRAAFKATARMARFQRERRRNEALTRSAIGIGLHVGNVMFGNVGLYRPLDLLGLRLGGERGAAPADPDQEISAPRSSPARISPPIAAARWVTLGKEKLRGVKEKLTVLHARHDRGGDAGGRRRVRRPALRPYVGCRAGDAAPSRRRPAAAAAIARSCNDGLSYRSRDDGCRRPRFPCGTANAASGHSLVDGFDGADFSPKAAGSTTRKISSRAPASSSSRVDVKQQRRRAR